MSAGDAEKAKGNAEFSAGNYDQAIVHFSAAIGLGATHVLYSNRSACYCGLRKYDEALEDVRAGRTSPARSTANAVHPHPRLTHLTRPTHTPAACADAHQLHLHARMLLRACVRLRAWPRLRACASACTPVYLP